MVKCCNTFTNFLAAVAAEITQSADQFRTRLILQLINDISRVFQKLIKYFNGKARSASLVLSSTGL